MFTGIVESLGTVKEIQFDRTNMKLTVESSISHELEIDQSVSHNGVCLTVTDKNNSYHTCTLIQETLNKSNFNGVQVNDLINLERSVTANARMDGHFVQGHVDTTANIMHIKDQHGSWVYGIHLPDMFKALVVSKGSVCINGVSLTISDLKSDFFEVSIIPYTFEHTNFNSLRLGDSVNIEFDILGKYIERMVKLRI